MENVDDIYVYEFESRNSNYIAISRWCIILNLPEGIEDQLTGVVYHKSQTLTRRQIVSLELITNRMINSVVFQFSKFETNAYIY